MRNKLLIIALLGVAVFYGCDNNGMEIGNNWVDAHTRTVLIDTCTVEVSSVLLDSVPATPAVEIENIGELREVISKLNEAAEKNQEPQEHIHKHRIELMSNKVLIMLAVAMTVIVFLAWIISNQRKTISRFRDNDLKYRYIEMRRSTIPEEILMLREVFDFNRNADSIKVIRRRVEKYERLMKEGAEQQARARANTEQAEELRQKADSVKDL